MPHDVVSLLMDAANLMMIGMFVVFLFLAALIGAVNVIAWLNQRFPESVVSSGQQPANPTKSNNALPSGLVAAITAAIHQHRSNK
jgi:oxaloacetate decarboxylase gamma subunit